jgi:hypothetical protein
MVWQVAWLDGGSCRLVASQHPVQKGLKISFVDPIDIWCTPNQALPAINGHDLASYGLGI